MAVHKWRFVYRNVRLGEPPGYIATSSVDLGGLDNLRFTDYPRPLHHGEDPGAPDLLAGRDITFGLTLIAEQDPVTASRMYNIVAGAWSPAADLAPLLIHAPENDYLSYGKPRRCVPDRSQLKFGVINATLQWHALDPLLYAATPAIVPVQVAPPTSGASAYPRGFPRGWSGDGSLNAALPNDGNAPSAPVVQIHAGASGCGTPRITDLNSGAYIQFDMTLDPGMWLVVDMDRGTVIYTPSIEDLSLGSSRANAVHRPGSDWLTVAPGGSAWSLSSITGSADASVICRSAWY